MKINRVFTIYFSPCGSTKAVCEGAAEALCAGLNIVRGVAPAIEGIPIAKAADADGTPVERMTIDFTLPAGREATWEFTDTDVVIFGTPTYAGRVPNKIVEYVQTAFHGHNTPAIPMVTFGNRNYDSSLAELAQELTAHGFRVIGARAQVSRHVFSEQLAPGRPDAEDLADIHQFIDVLTYYLSRAASIDDFGPCMIDGGDPVQPYYVPKGEDGQPVRFLKAKPVTDPDLCDGCGICEGVCPMGSIRRTESGAYEASGVCIKCQACVKACPKGAKHFEDAAFLSHVRMLEQNFERLNHSESYFAGKQA